VDGGLINTVPVSVCRETGAQYVIGVNVVPAPTKAMCNPNKNQQFQFCDLTKLQEVGEETNLPRLSRIQDHSLRTHIYEIENST
jgi:predicted acylesterase/phospholipase RssA